MLSAMYTERNTKQMRTSKVGVKCGFNLKELMKLLMLRFPIILFFNDF